jgi:hypothetical protein
LDLALAGYIQHYNSAGSVLGQLDYLRASEVIAYADHIWEDVFADIYVEGSFSEPEAEGLGEDYDEMKSRIGYAAKPSDFTRYQSAEIYGYGVFQQTKDTTLINQLTLYLWNRNGVDSEA